MKTVPKFIFHIIIDNFSCNAKKELLPFSLEDIINRDKSRQKREMQNKGKNYGFGRVEFEVD